MGVQINKLSFKGQNIFVGIDVHLKSWSVVVLSEHSVLKKFSQNPDAEALFKFLATSYPGAIYHSVYEAGFCGFWIHERLVSLGINNMVVNPADVPTMSKEKLRKTDAVDCGKLAREFPKFQRWEYKYPLMSLNAVLWQVYHNRPNRSFVTFPYSSLVHLQD